jgi:lysozyme family protein
VSFKRAVEITLDFEGEQSDHPEDPGGLTRFGIAQRWHPTVDVAALDRAGAMHLLCTEYWRPIRGDSLPWPLAAAVFDHAVHSGPRQAVIALQRAAGAPPDGIVGTRTLAAVADAAPRALLAEVLALRARELARTGKATFVAGWMARLAQLGLLLGMELAQTPQEPRVTLRARPGE